MKLHWKQPFRLAAAFVRSARRTILGIPVLVRSETYDERMRVCGKCEHFDGQQCYVCHCWMPAKAWLSAERCPDNPPRWQAL